jgi:chorismate mutase/prephenate dehydratase
MSEDKGLDSIRKKIDLIDEKILSLINERAALAIAAGKAKGDSSKYKPSREASIYNKLIEINTGPLTAVQIISIYKEIISSCRSTEADFKVSFLGPEGTYSESAMKSQFGDSVKKNAEETIESVFQSVQDNKSDFGIVPIENSTEGAVNLTLDCLAKFNLTICGEVEMRINHNLLGYNKPLPKEGFEIHAHEQTLAQCKQWLDSYCPGVKRVAVTSNAKAAINASKSDSVFAIAGKLAAEKYGLDILDKNIEDYFNNTTRFISIGKITSEASGLDKTSLLVTTKNEPGALYEVLRPINELELNLTHITYRPSRIDNWHYSFYLDVEGHQAEEKIQKLLSGLNETEADVRVLGSFPKAIS